MRLLKVTGIFFVAFVLLSTVLPLPVLAAGNDTTTGSISLVPTIKCIGVVASYSGDDNGNNSAVLTYRKSGGAWKTAHEMYVDRSDKEFRGSIFWLDDGTTYEVRVTFSDNDNVAGTNPVTGTTTTREEDPPIGTSYLYVATTGSDSSGDGSQGNPWKTIGKAASSVSAGDTVLVRGGTYTISSSISVSTSGTANNYITFMPYQGESVTIDGNDSVDNIFDLSGNYIRIRGFKFQDDAYDSSGGTIRLAGADYCIIEYNYFLNPAGPGTLMLRSLASHNTYRYNEVYIDEKIGYKQDGVYYWKAGNANVFYSNTFTSAIADGMWDGFEGGPEDDLGYMYDTDIYDNNIIFSSDLGDGWDRDDGIQVEGGGVNVRIWGNRIENSYAGIAMAPVLEGPYYVFRNVMYNVKGYMFKCGNNSYGRVYAYHNTYYAGTAGGKGATQSNSGLGNYVYKNNIIIAGSKVYELITIPSSSSIDFDYNNLYPEENYQVVELGGSSWGGKYNSVPAYVAALNKDVHSISENGDDCFTDADNGDFTLSASSDCIDAGTPLVMFNDTDSPWPYEGNAPDIGARESGSSGPTNNPPVAVNDSYSTDEDIILDVTAPGVLNNDTDADEDPLTAIKISNPSHGTVVLDSDGSFTYTPSANYNGTDSFTYRANDGWANSNTATVTITINPTEDTPVAVNDSYSANHDTTLNIAAPGVLSNDTDADEDPLTVIKLSDPSHGSVTLNSNGSFVYDPDTDYYGTDSFTYRANDGTQNSNTATVTITIDGGNNPPVAANDSYSTGDNVNLDIPAPGVLGNDTDADEDPLMAIKLTEPSHGTVTLNSDGSFFYNPDYLFAGADSFTYQVFDGQDNSNIATVTINVGGENNPPVAVNDSYFVNEDYTLNISAPGVLNNDTDADEDPLTAVKISNPSHGTVTLNSNGSFVYNPDTNYNGTDSFTYRANDGADNSNTATVTITINPRNDAPVLASIGDKTVTEGETLVFTVSATDPDGDPMIYSAYNLPVGASFDSTTRVFSWIPDEDQIGTHYGLRFRVRDNHYRYDYELISVIVRPDTENPPGDGGGGGSGGGGAGGGGTTSLSGMMTGDGVIVLEVLCTLDDQVIKIIIPKDTIVKTRNGGNASYIRIKKSDEQTDLGEYCYGVTGCYIIEPNGVTFEPSVPLIFKYDPDNLPEGMSADSLYIARYDPDTQEWTNLGGIVDPETCTVTTEIEHLSLYAVLAETQPASFEVAGFSISPQEIIPGGTVTASAVINNQGNLYGTCEVQLILDNTVVQAKTIDLAGGASETITFLISSDVTGEHRLSIGDMARMFSVIVPEAPASFTVSGLSINPDSVHPGDNVYISALITNNGEAAGTYQVALVINDITVQTKVVTLNGGQSTPVSFSVAPDRYGLNHVSIEDLLDSFEVKPVPPPIIAEVANQAEVTNFSTALNYDEATNKLVYAKIVYQMNLPYNALPDARLILTVLFNNELLEQIPLLTFSQLQPDGKTGQLNYIPSTGWEIGEYSFRVELYNGEIFVQDTPLEKVIVTPESITKNVSWWTLGAVIGVAMILIIAFLAVMIYRKRDILEEEAL